MICSCGGACTASDVKGGTSYTCRACGRREFIDWSARRDRQDPEISQTPTTINEVRSVGETMQLFEATISNLLTMPPMPRKRKK